MKHVITFDGRKWTSYHKDQNGFISNIKDNISYETAMEMLHNEKFTTTILWSNVFSNYCIYHEKKIK